jgi:7-dehydrocholesterol reductase
MGVSGAPKIIGLFPGRQTFGPLFLLIFAPIFVQIAIFILSEREGSVELFWKDLTVKRRGGLKWLLRTVLLKPLTDVFAWKIIAIFMGFQLLLMRLIPASEFRGPVTATGNVPVYKANGFSVYLITIAVYCSGTYFGYFSGGILYDNIGKIISAMNIFAILFCIFLYFKGILAPSTSDCGTTSNPFFDFFWGTELYPSVLGWNVKQFTNCRLGMMFWAIYVLSCLFKQAELSGNVSNALSVNVALQSIYIAKFFWWETGYFTSIDIMYDRAGFYIVWGVLVWLPCLYTSHSTYLVRNPSDFGPLTSLAVFAAGAVSIYVNYDVDRQRQDFRACNGRCKIWGRDPFFVEAKHRNQNTTDAATTSGEWKTSLLLGSGYWGLSRHFNYVPEIMASVCWTLPVWTPKLLPWFYVPYLTVLLLDRAARDDARCSAKYGKYWDQYCKRVQYLVIPQIF